MYQRCPYRYKNGCNGKYTLCRSHATTVDTFLGFSQITDMEGQSYISCIKINGFPILPPMMTEEIRESMNHYKKLAIAIEEKVKDRLHKSFNRNRSMVTVKRGECQEESSGDADYQSNAVHSSESESISLDTPANTVITLLPKTIVSKVEKCVAADSNGGGTEKTVPWHESSATNNALSICTSLHNGSASRAGTVFRDRDEARYLEEDPTTKSSSVTEIPTEAWKPRVPKTLDIVPIILNGPSCDTSLEHVKDRSTDTEDTPKLVRQGSYVLETPSPMLLAHMQTEINDYVDTSSTTYIPTASENASRRKEWNILVAKAEWEHCSNAKEPAERPGYHKREISEKPISEKMSKSVSLQTDSESPPEICRTTRSVDCIQSMLATEFGCQDSHRSAYGQSRNSCSSQDRDRREGRREDFKLTGGLERLAGQRGSHRTARPKEEPKDECARHIETRKNWHGRSLENLVTDRSPTGVARPTSASERLISVYREIQQIHEKQMMDLVARQRVEQTLLQEEFEKQQMFLLEEIKKSFPELPIGLISVNVPVRTGSIVLQPEEDPSDDAETAAAGRRWEAECKGPRPKVKDDSPLEDRDQRQSSLSGKSPVQLDQNVESNVSHVTVSSEENVWPQQAFTCTPPVGNEKVRRNTEMETQAIRTIDGEEGARINVSERKYVNVNRQLFPLDGKTIQVPIPDSSVHVNEHVQAVNIINAYARGYLVRRMMRTERVVALKDTYKEALHYMLRLHVDAPLNLSELNFLHRLQLQCDAASMNIVELFARSPAKRMQIIAQDRELQRSRTERPSSARSFSFATQRTLARKKLKEMGDYPLRSATRSCSSRSRCQTWTSDIREKPLSPNILHRTIRRSTSAGTVRKPWR